MITLFLIYVVTRNVLRAKKKLRVGRSLNFYMTYFHGELLVLVGRSIANLVV